MPCHTLQIAPMITGGTDPAAAASLSHTMDAASLESQFPNIDTTKHVVMEVNEPNFFAELAEGHAQREAWRKIRQPQILAELEAQRKAEASSVGPVPAVDAASSVAPLDPLAAVNSDSVTSTQTPANTDTTVESMDVVAAQHVATIDGRRKLLQTNVVHDLLVVYTPAAVSFAGGVAAIENAIRISVQYTNLAYANSRIAVYVRLVGMRQVSVQPQ